MNNVPKISAEIIRKTLRDGKTSQQEVQVFANLLNAIDKILVWDSTAGEYRILKSFFADGKPDYNNITSLAEEQYVDAITRLNGLRSKPLDIRRSGDIVLLMKDDSTNIDITQRFTTGAACMSWHGSLNPSDSYVPFIIAYPGGSKQIIEGRKTKACAGTGCKANWDLGDIVKEFINTQFK